MRGDESRLNVGSSTSRSPRISTLQHADQAPLAIDGGKGRSALDFGGERVVGSPADETITAHGTSGVHRHAKADAKGRYTIASLSMGVYTVAPEKDGNAAETRSNIPLTVGRGSEVDFACPTTNAQSLQVTGHTMRCQP